MENSNDNQFTNDIAPLPARPQFLKVLCILTWIWCGISFISTTYKLVGQSPEKREESIEKMREINPEMADKLETVVNSEDRSTVMMTLAIDLVAIILSAYGAVLMWKLKKTGFYVYIAGEIIPYFGFLMGGARAMAAIGGVAGAMGGAIVGIVFGLMVIFDLAFIIMYGVNLKYMK